jgi:mannose-1-phosphate guanylyltransferase
MRDPEIWAVILAGGSGTRFWPASRTARPKQFLPITGRAPMIAETWARLEGLVPPERILVVTAASQAELVREACPALLPENLLAEPVARNTAPAVALAAFEIRRRAPESVQVVLPADHVIRPATAFRATLAAGAREAAESGALLTFGIRPTHPATGYGYVHAGERVREVDGHPVHAVTRFVEKPDLATAERFLAEGGFFWNAGIFAWSSDAIAAALSEHVPALVAGLERWLAGADLAELYARFESQPIDVAVLEKAANVRCVPIDYPWNDVGSWAALPELIDAGPEGNWDATTGGARTVTVDAEGCVVYAEGDQVIALVGVKDLVVVRAGDATLVCPRDRAQDVKQIVDALKKEAPEFL